MKAKNIIMACSMLMLLPAIASGQQLKKKWNDDAFNECWSMIKPMMKEYQEYKEYISEEEITNLENLESNPFDYKWSWTVSFDTTFEWRLNCSLVAVANTDKGKVTFCHAWQDEKEILIWAK